MPKGGHIAAPLGRDGVDGAAAVERLRHWLDEMVPHPVADAADQAAAAAATGALAAPVWEVRVRAQRLWIAVCVVQLVGLLAQLCSVV